MPPKALDSCNNGDAHSSQTNAVALVMNLGYATQYKIIQRRGKA